MNENHHNGCWRNESESDPWKNMKSRCFENRYFPPGTLCQNISASCSPPSLIGSLECLLPIPPTVSRFVATPSTNFHCCSPFSKLIFIVVLSVHPIFNPVGCDNYFMSSSIAEFIRIYYCLKQGVYKCW